MTTRIVIASHHPRNDWLEEALVAVDGYDILRLREKGELTKTVLDDFGADWVFVPHWSFIIPEEVHANFRTVIFHMTDLPYGRGGSPLQNLIMRGHSVTQLSALQCEAGLDTGPIFLKRELSLDGTAEEIFHRTNKIMLPMIQAIVDQDIVPTVQSGEPTEFKRRRPNQSALDEAQSLVEAYDHIRMLDAEGYPHAFIETEHFRVMLTRARLSEDGAVIAEARIVKKDTKT